jgi:hypothetical protein
VSKGDRNRGEKLRSSDKSDVHENLPSAAETFIMLIMAGRKRKCRVQTLVVRSCFSFISKLLESEISEIKRRPSCYDS